MDEPLSAWGTMRSMRTMRNVGLAVISLLVAAPASAGPAEAPIRGGTRAAPGQFPSTLALLNNGTLCSATLLTREWVLTAAHCISMQTLAHTQAEITASQRIHVGTIDVFNDPGTVLTASATIPHPGFNINRLGSHDIGLIKLSTPLTDVTPVPVNLERDRVSLGAAVTMVGYGSTQPDGGGTLGVEFFLQHTVSSCGSPSGDANLLCFDERTGRGKCRGDSGGPTFATINGRMTQAGISSFGDLHCTEFSADTRIDAERDFLLQHVPELKCTIDDICAPGCGFGALPIDPDCPVCDGDDDCGDGRVCFDSRCIVEPFEPTGLGAACTTGTECETGECATRGTEELCTLTCTRGVAGACPDGFACVEAAGDAGACWPDDGGGCCSTGSRGAPTSLLGFAVIGLALRRRRRC